MKRLIILWIIVSDINQNVVSDKVSYNFFTVDIDE